MFNWFYELFGTWKHEYSVPVSQTVCSPLLNKEWQEYGLAILERHSISNRLRARTEMSDGTNGPISLEYVISHAKSSGVDIQR